MGFWLDVASGFLANVAAAAVIVAVYVVVQWFLTATDVIICYNWQFDGPLDNPRNLRPGFDIRNRSRSKTYVLANIAYLKEGKPFAPYDNSSVWGKELKPGTIQNLGAGPVPSLASLKQSTEVEVYVRLQNPRVFWLKGQGPGQPRTGKIQRAAFWLRNKFERAAVPLE